MANETLAAAQQQIATGATQGRVPAQEAAKPAVFIPDLTPEQAASIPGALVANSAKHQGLTKAYPSRDRQHAYARMRKAATQSGGKYPQMTGPDGKPMDVEAYITLIEGANAKVEVEVYTTELTENDTLVYVISDKEGNELGRVSSKEKVAT
ncbi:MAG: hypothetical protein IKZ02_02250, partial [Alphaproteobacteria bacterium]|nr:hypothetical protein [Alphaproteobacteria bacterium]